MSPPGVCHGAMTDSDLNDRAFSAFSFHAPPSLVYEPGAAARLGELASDLLGPRILFVTDEGLTRLGLTGPALASLSDVSDVTVFDRVEADPSRANLEAAIRTGQGTTGVVGFGGGSSMDVAKLAALLISSGEDLDEAWGVGNAVGPRLPLALVPTTAGTGSEVTPVSIITVGGAEKRGVSSRLLVPDLAVLDPDLTLGLPREITAATGIDAMVHAVEAFTSRSSNANPVSRALALEALRLLGANIERAVQVPGDRDQRGAMLLGSMLAGQAFANAPVAAVHALAYPIGGRYHVPHGLSNALVLPHVLRFNASDCANEYAALVPAAFPGVDRGEGPEQAPAALADGFSRLSRRLGLPQRLRDVGVPKADLRDCAVDAMLQTRLLVNNPKPLSEADAFAIYEAAW